MHITLFGIYLVICGGIHKIMSYLVDSRFEFVDYN